MHQLPFLNCSMPCTQTTVVSWFQRVVMVYGAEAVTIDRGAKQIVGAGTAVVTIDRGTKRIVGAGTATAIS